MEDSRKLAERIFKIQDAEDFSECALEVFRFQYEHCEVYRAFNEALSVDPAHITRPEEITFMPVMFFKSLDVICRGAEPLKVFYSSGTTGMTPGRHLIADPGLYETSLLEGFRAVFGPPGEYTFLSLTPGPVENPHSSLVFMIRTLMLQNPGLPHGFYLDDPGKLLRRLETPAGRNGKMILFGLAYALLDFAEKYAGNYSGLTVIETGGMKGRKKEITRKELHDRLSQGFSGASIWSEYGMTELLSQAYSGPGDVFVGPPWMKVFIREINDPFTFVTKGKTGGINIIDLANLYSCSFIATDDLGRAGAKGGFGVLGRFDSSDLRGCSLMLQE
jgi:hypothetical protein